MSRSSILLLPSLALLVTLTSCSSPSQPPAAPTTPKVSLSEEPSPSPSATPDLDEALSFVKAIYLEKNDDAAQYVADNSVAARYLAHQAALAEVDSNNGDTADIDRDDYDFDADEGSESVKVEYTGGDDTSTYVWQDFTFTDGKIASWEVKGQPKLEKRLWHAKASDESRGVKATLVSAYESNDGTVQIVVDLASKSRNVRIEDSSYSPIGGYRREDAANLWPDVEEGGKTLTYFTFNKAHVGGQLKLTVNKVDSDDDSLSSRLTNLTLKVA